MEGFNMIRFSVWLFVWLLSVLAVFAGTPTPTATATVSMSDVVAEFHVGNGIELCVFGFFVGVWLLWKALI